MEYLQLNFIDKSRVIETKKGYEMVDDQVIVYPHGREYRDDP